MLSTWWAALETMRCVVLTVYKKVGEQDDQAAAGPALCETSSNPPLGSRDAVQVTGNAGTRVHS